MSSEGGQSHEITQESPEMKVICFKFFRVEIAFLEGKWVNHRTEWAILSMATLLVHVIRRQ